MFAKIEITGILEVVTGLHIGGSSAFAAIGAVDSPVIKDQKTGDPVIPGSSLKGKMRSLLAKKYNVSFASSRIRMRNASPVSLVRQRMESRGRAGCYSRICT